MMLNVVADIEGVGAAVLIRSCSPVSGMHCSSANFSHNLDKE
jgi:3-methyladenine DNA glycosylase Mpg